MADRDHSLAMQPWSHGEPPKGSQHVTSSSRHAADHLSKVMAEQSKNRGGRHITTASI
jgi:hypothetical protein